MDDNFSYLEKPLYNMQPSTIRPKKDADDESNNSYMEYDSFAPNSDEEYD